MKFSHRRQFLHLAAGAFALPALIVGICCCGADAAEIKFLCAITFRGALTELVPHFERSSGHKITIEYATIGIISDRLRKDEAVDVAVVSDQQSQDLQKEGKIVAGSPIIFAKVGLGAAVRKGAVKPDISSVEALKRTLLNAKSIGYGDPAAGGVSGTYLAKLVQRLGIAAELKEKTRLGSSGASLFEEVAKGIVEIGFENMTSLVLHADIDIVGPLPSEIQNYTTYAAGVASTRKELDAGKALVAFLSSPAAAAILKAKGFEPAR